MATTTVRRRRSAFAAGLATLAMVLGLAAAPAQAVAKIDYYVALGDSYAAGQGAGPYLDACFRSENAYSELADNLKTVKKVTNAACGGRTTQGVVNEQLGQLNRKTELVTITAGGNNLGFANIVTYCGAVAFGDTTAGPACGVASAYAEAQFTTGQLYVDVLSMIQSVHAAAPNARIVVTGYPYLFDPIADGRTDSLALFTYQATKLADNLDGTIALAATKAALGGIDVNYVDVRMAFAGHGIMTPDPWINFGSPAVADNFHPNAQGYQAYFAALSAAGAYLASKRA
ncbi:MULTISPECIES: SGNH/GDSL hydrolase family protein [unclassified Arthrobacter]|uniref:SGNH/GDSL hydrolase family protein n=1 Tax=unclassified Arthrobacter TaxID=235627 RepID=UPI003390C4C4